jgi:hypothetical protein
VVKEREKQKQNLTTKSLMLAKLSFKNEGEIRIFPDNSFSISLGINLP